MIVMFAPDVPFGFNLLKFKQSTLLFVIVAVVIGA